MRSLSRLSSTRHRWPRSVLSTHSTHVFRKKPAKTKTKPKPWSFWPSSPTVGEATAMKNVPPSILSRNLPVSAFFTLKPTSSRNHYCPRPCRKRSKREWPTSPTTCIQTTNSQRLNYPRRSGSSLLSCKTYSGSRSVTGLKDRSGLFWKGLMLRQASRFWAATMTLQAQCSNNVNHQREASLQEKSASATRPCRTSTTHTGIASSQGGQLISQEKETECVSAFRKTNSWLTLVTSRTRPLINVTRL